MIGVYWEDDNGTTHERPDVIVLDVYVTRYTPTDDGDRDIDRESTDRLVWSPSDGDPVQWAADKITELGATSPSAYGSDVSDAQYWTGTYSDPYGEYCEDTSVFPRMLSTTERRALYTALTAR